MLSVIRCVIDTERDTSETDPALIDAAVEANTPVAEDLAVTVLADEVPYRTEFERFETGV